MNDRENPAAKPASEMFSACESPVEGELLHCLLKAYHIGQIQQQYQVGIYRLDFLTCDGIGWELDGKQFHDPHRDHLRDQWILGNSEVRQIIRIPAAALMFYRDASLAAIGHLVPSLERWKVFCRNDADKFRSEADELVREDFYSLFERGIFESWESIDHGESFEVYWENGFVGRPFAFLDGDHQLCDFFRSHGYRVNRWKARIVSVTAKS